VPGRGVEPRSPGLQPGALPLSEPDAWFSCQDSNPDDEVQGLASDHWTTGEDGSPTRTRTWSLPIQSRAFYHIELQVRMG
jgi:hypothetical protein